MKQGYATIAAASLAALVMGIGSAAAQTALPGVGGTTSSDSSTPSVTGDLNMLPMNHRRARPARISRR